MQVWTKLTLGFAATAIAIVGLYGLYQLRHEAADLRQAAVRDVRLIGTAVRVATENALRDRQDADVREIVEALELRDSAVDLMVLNVDGIVTTGQWVGSTEGTVRQAVAESQVSRRSVVRFEGTLGLSYLVGVFPIESDRGDRIGTLAVVRELDELRRDLSAEVRATVLALGTLVMGLTVAGWLLAYVHVRRPLVGLVGAMRSVRGGDLSAKASVDRADEVGAAISEFNTMVADLAEARERLVSEGQARKVLETNLQRLDKLATVGQLSASVAHEVGSPLQVLNGRARALAARADLPADVRRTADVLARESDRITRIVERMLSYSRKTAPSVSDARLTTHVRHIIELMAPEARRRGVRLTFVSANELPRARVDVAQVQQVVMNLISNALQSTPGGGEVRVALEPASYSTVAGGTVPSVLLRVDDTGEGMPDDLLQHVFEPFFTTRSRSGGTGLGLSVVRAIVDAHAGRISVSSRVGEGTRFSVHFPATVGRAAMDGQVA